MKTLEANHIVACANTDTAHVDEMHLCAVCDAPDHGLHQCPVLRACFGRRPFWNNWLQWTPANDSKHVYLPKKDSRRPFGGKDNKTKDSKKKDGKK